VLEAGATAAPSASLISSSHGTGDIGTFPSGTERPLGAKAAKRKKRGAESVSPSQAEIASSIRVFSETMKNADEEAARIQRQKLRFQEQSNRLRIYEARFCASPRPLHKRRCKLASPKCEQCSLRVRKPALTSARRQGLRPPFRHTRGPSRRHQ
jgi:hypothetical protein